MESWLADRVEIADLFARFALLLDEKRWDDAGTVFADDFAANTPRVTLRGLDKLVEFFRQADVEEERTQHITTDLLVDVDGDRAAASANSLVYFFREGRAPHRASGLRLTYTAVRTPAGWRLSEGRTVLAWMREDAG